MAGRQQQVLGTYLEQVDKGCPRFTGPATDASWSGCNLGCLHDPLLLLVCALALGTMRLRGVFRGRNLLHCLEEFGCLGIGNSVRQCGVMGDCRERTGGARKQLRRNVGGGDVLRRRRIDGAGLGENKSDQCQFLCLWYTVSSALQQCTWLTYLVYRRRLELADFPLPCGLFAYSKPLATG